MSVAAYNTILQTTGTSTALSSEATTNTTGNKYQITNAAKRVLDPAVAVVVKDGVSVVTGVTIDYLFGVVTLPAPPGGAVTIFTGSYLPLLDLAQCRSVNIDINMAELDKSVFSSTIAGKQRIAGLLDGSMDIERLDFPDSDLDPGAGTVKLQSLMLARTPILVSCQPGGSGRIIRGWFIATGDSKKAAVADLFMATLKLKLAAQGGSLTNTAAIGISIT